LRLEYFEDPQSPEPPVLLIYGDELDTAARLREAIVPFLDGQTGREFRVDCLPGFQGVDGCLLTAQLGDSDLGVVPIDSGDRAFRCVLDAAGWRHVFDLLEPFTTGDLTPSRHAHQYLTETGAIEWIVSTNREWWSGLMPR
jgi:hypothetical protein